FLTLTPMYEVMVATARQALEVPREDVMPKEAEPRERTLEALMILWHNRLPRGVLVSIFADLIPQADPRPPPAAIEPRDVVVDGHGIARIESRRARVGDLVSLFTRTTGMKPLEGTVGMSRARAMSWMRSLLGPAAPRDRVLVAFGGVGVPDGVELSSMP